MRVNEKLAYTFFILIEFDSVVPSHRQSLLTHIERPPMSDRECLRLLRNGTIKDDNRHYQSERKCIAGGQSE